MKIPLYNTTKDFEIENFSPPSHIQTHLKENVFIDGSSEMNFFGARKPSVEITFAMLTLAEQKSLKEFFINNENVEVQQKELFGANPKDVKSWFCSANVLDVAGVDIYSKNDLTNSLTVQFVLNYYVKNNDDEINIKSVDKDFVLLLYPNAVVCDVFKSTLDLGAVSFTLGQSNITASLIPEALENDRVFILSHKISGVTYKSAYLYKKVGSNLVLINHLTYSDVDFIALEKTDIAKEGQTALYNNQFYRMQSFTWVVSPLPPISQFKKVILSSSSDYISRGSDRLQFSYFGHSVILEGGLSLPRRSINIEDGGAVEYPQSFEVSFNNAKRKHWDSLNSGFNGSICEIWYQDGSNFDLVTKGVCTGSNEDYSAYTLSFDPLSFNLYEKELLTHSKRSVYGSWGYISANLENKENIFKLFESNFGTVSSYSNKIHVNHTISSGQELRYFVQFGDEKKKAILESGSDYSGTWLRVQDENYSENASKPIFIYSFEPQFLIADNHCESPFLDKSIKAFVKSDADNLEQILDGAFSWNWENAYKIGQFSFENKRQKDIEISNSGVITSFDRVIVPANNNAYDNSDSVQFKNYPFYYSWIPSLPTYEHMGYGIYKPTSLTGGYTYSIKQYDNGYRNFPDFYMNNLEIKVSSNSVNGFFQKALEWNRFKFLRLFELNNFSIRKGEEIEINYFIPFLIKHHYSYVVKPIYKGDVYGLTKTTPIQWILLKQDFEYCKEFKSDEDDISSQKLDLSNPLCYDANDNLDFSHIGIFCSMASNAVSARGNGFSVVQPLVYKTGQTITIGENKKGNPFFDESAYNKNSNQNPNIYINKNDLILSVKKEFDLSDTIYVKDFQGRRDILGSFPNNYNSFYNEATRTASIPISLSNMPSSVYYDKLRMLFEDSYSYKELLEDIAKHSFCGLRLDGFGNYIPFDLDIKNRNTIFEFNESNIIEGSFQSVKFRDSLNIANGIEVKFHFSAINEELTRTIKAYVKGENILIEGLESIDKDRYEMSANDEAKASFTGNLSQLKIDMDFSKTFYGIVSQTNKSFELPWFYDCSTIENSDPLSAPVRWIEKVARWFLFNSWSFSIQSKIELFLGANALSIGDYVSVKTYFHSDSYDVLGVINGIDPDVENGIATIEIYSPIPPEVSASLYDNIWNGGIIDENYDVNNYKHKAIIQKYPFKNDPEGDFSDGGVIDSSYDATQLQFIDGTFADPEEPISPLP